MWAWIGLAAIAMIVLAMLVGHRLARLNREYPLLLKEPPADVPRRSVHPGPRRTTALRLVKG